MKIALVSLCARRGQKQQNLERILAFGESAAEAGCRLVVFPEYSVNGPWVTYDPEAKMEDLERDAESIPGPSTEILAACAQRLDIAFCVGLAEKGLVSKPFNTQVVVDRTGVIHKQSKLQPTISETAFYRGGGDVVSAFVLAGHCFGIVICADNGQRAIYDCLIEQGVQTILAPHAGAIKKYEEPGNSWAELTAWHRANRLGRHGQRAVDFGFTFAYCDLKDPRDAFDALPELEHYVSGKSAVFRSDGTCIAENAGNEESLLVVEI